MLLLMLLSAPAQAAERKSLSEEGSELAQKLNPFPRPTHFTGFQAILPWYTFGSVFCSAGGLIAGGITHELTNEEAQTIVASCFLPGLGPILVKLLFARHPEWNRYHCEPLDRDKIDLMKISGWSPKCWRE